jgi:hypothetical protein
VRDLDDPRTSGSLDRGRRHVDDHVEGARRRPHEHERESELPDRAGEGGEHDRGAEQEKCGWQRPRSHAVDDPSGDEHGGKRREPDSEQRGTEPRDRSARLLLHVWEEDSPGAPEGAERSERGERPGRPTYHAAVWQPRRGRFRPRRSRSGTPPGPRAEWRTSRRTLAAPPGEVRAPPRRRPARSPW